MLITGRTSLKGSHLIDRLLKEGRTVTNIDNFNPFYDESIKQENMKGRLQYNSYRLNEVDIQDEEALDKAIPNDA